MSAQRSMPWVMRASWAALLFFGWEAIESTTDRGTSDIAPIAAIAGVMWLCGLAAVALPTVTGLTVLRSVAPLSIPAGVLAWVGGGGWHAAALLATGAAASALACTAQTGRAFVQASAYGHEDRYVLRPPLAYAAVSVLAWLVIVAVLVLGTLAWWRGERTAGAAAALLGLGAGLSAIPRWHRLARRWLVVVPSGVVVHDHLVLAETLMIRRQELAAIRLAPATTTAADLTGPATGHALELLTRQPVTAILAASPRQPAGKVIHLTGALVAPTRPGQALRAAAARRFPVG